MNQNYRMIDVGNKEVTRRKAIARGSIRLSPTTMQMIVKGDSPKGNILSMAEVAGIMAAKNTSGLLPLCHPLILDSIRIGFELDTDHDLVHAHCEVVCHAKTGVEMEALVGLNICLLTIYDLAKAVDPVIEINNIYLQSKEGGKSGLWKHPKLKPTDAPTATPTTATPASTTATPASTTATPASTSATPASTSATPASTSSISTSTASESADVSFQKLRFAVGTLSDRASQGVYQDQSGTLLRNFCSERSGVEVFYKVIPDDKEALLKLVYEAVEHKVDVLLLTGGTGISKRDITPDIIKEISSKELTGFGELQRQFGSQYTKASWLSRASAYVVKDTLVVLFPGSPKAVQQGLDCMGSLIPHAVRMLRGESHHDETTRGVST